MPCFYPLKAYRSKKNDGNIVFNTKYGHAHSHFDVPCGQCTGCRLERSRKWAVRCMHEAQMHTHNQYITLTYSDDNLPNNNSLLKSDLQKFWKRLRKKYPKFRYYACGEYGDSTYRPHYHAIIFGLHLADKTFHSTSTGFTLYTSDNLTQIWNRGHAVIGDVTFESCAYVARYIMKKALGKTAKTHYQHIDKSTGEIDFELTPEFTTMSRRPGIGLPFFNKYSSDMYQEGTDGLCIIRSDIKTSTPKYYDDKFASQSEKNAIRMETIKTRRKIQAQLSRPDNTRERLIVKEKISLRITNNKLPRNLE